MNVAARRHGPWRALPVLLASFVAEVASGQTNVGGSIATNPRWTMAGSPYVATSDLMIGGGATLLIDPGVEVRFAGGLGLTVGAAGGKGTLVARGTSASPIRFTRSSASSYWRSIRLTVDAVEAAF